MSKTIKPLVSIILPTFNDENHIKDTIESVLSQSHKDFEFIVINDASTDNTEVVLDPYLKKDKRFKYIVNSKNLGLSRSLNKGIKHSKGKYLARIDGDDIWISPNKLEQQIKFLEKNPDHVLIGTWAHKTDLKGNVLAKLQYPINDEKIRKYIMIENCFIHSSIVMRKSALPSLDAYDSDYPVAVDYSLWLRLGTRGKFHNIPKYMVAYRTNPNGLSKTKYKMQLDYSIKAVNRHKKDYSFYPIGVSLWYLRRMIPTTIRERVSKKLRSMM